MNNVFFSWRSAFQKSNLKPGTKLVLFCISTYMNDHGFGAYPSIKTLESDTSFSNRVVILHIKRAVEAGFLKVSKHGFSGKAWARNEYKIAYPTMQNKAVTKRHYEGNKVVTIPTQGDDDSCNKAVTKRHTNSPYNSPYNSPTRARGNFEEWYLEYPRKVARGSAVKAYNSAIKKIPPDDLLVKTRLFARSIKNTEQKYIPHPSTWLNQERWADEPVVHKKIPRQL